MYSLAEWSAMFYRMLKRRATLFATLTIVIYLVWKLLNFTETEYQVSK